MPSVTLFLIVKNQSTNYKINEQIGIKDLIVNLDK